jgi:8-oxo-dGTP pyrophosphatase MutT (NUDIX family)
MGTPSASVTARLPRAWRPADAAVAVILRPRGDADAELLFIRRPQRRGDRWSGDLAFPGGLAEPGEDAARTAAREAAEEVALRLPEPLGALGDRITARSRSARHLGRRPWMRVRPVVFEVGPGAEPTPDPREVAEAFWVPLSRLRRLPTVPTVRRIGRVPLPFPALDLDGRELWGLTLLMVRELRRSAVP